MTSFEVAKSLTSKHYLYVGPHQKEYYETQCGLIAKDVALGVGCLTISQNILSQIFDIVLSWYTNFYSILFVFLLLKQDLILSLKHIVSEQPTFCPRSIPNEHAILGPDCIDDHSAMNCRVTCKPGYRLHSSDAESYRVSIYCSNGTWTTTKWDRERGFGVSNICLPEGRVPLRYASLREPSL